MSRNSKNERSCSQALCDWNLEGGTQLWMDQTRMTPRMSSLLSTKLPHYQAQMRFTSRRYSIAGHDDQGSSTMSLVIENQQKTMYIVVNFFFADITKISHI